MRGKKVVDNYFNGANNIKTFKQLKVFFMYLPLKFCQTPR